MVTHPLKLYLAFQLLLKDPCPEVRSVTVQGLCRIFAVFWEWAPTEVVNDLLTVICTELAFDTASPDVRWSVIEGVRFILEHMPLSHITLKRRSGSLVIHDKRHDDAVLSF